MCPTNMGCRGGGARSVCFLDLASASTQRYQAELSHPGILTIYIRVVMLDIMDKI